MSTPHPSSSSVPAPSHSRVLRLWRRLLGSADSPGSLHAEPEPALASSKTWKGIRQCLQASAAQAGGETAARERVAQLLAFYQQAHDTDKRQFFQVLEDEYRTDDAKVRECIRQYLEASDAAAQRKAEMALDQSLESPRWHILRQFNLVPHGIDSLVRMRADLLQLTSTPGSGAGKEGKNAASAGWPGVDQDLFRLFSLWFDAGFLELSRIGWGSPASLLEKVIRYEAVHEIKSWNDLRNRLDSDRRCYAFFHGRMPEEPLIFVEVALVQQVAASVQTLLDEAEPTQDPGTATTAIFYSISNAQQGLRGVSMGEFLIKRVVEQLMHEFPRLQTFATLSPVPGFNRWLQGRWNEPEYRASQPKAIQKLLADTAVPEATKAIQQWLQPQAPIARHALAALQEWLQGECAWYLLHEKRQQHPLDAVARFHFSNGASLHRINWLADTSANGLRQSCGLMVNYLYQLDEIDDNHRHYAENGQLKASPEVRKLLQTALVRRK